MNQSNIRNFCVVAHIDHGKSTLADRMLEMTGTVAPRDMHAQLLDSNPIERERGITIKLAPVRMHWKRVNSKQKIENSNKEENLSIHSSLFTDNYILNLIDTPGHVDFGYEVSRSLAACEGALLVVDATQGVQAQTLANLHQARAHNLTIIPLINKIDMPNAKIEETGRELEALGFPPISPITPNSPILISAKTGENVDKVLEAVVERIPSPKGDPLKPLRALIFSSHYETHKGVVVFVRVVDGSMQYDPNLRVRFMATNSDITPIELGVFTPQMVVMKSLSCGEVGYIATGLKDVKIARVGDTVTTVIARSEATRQSHDDNGIASSRSVGSRDELVPLAGYKEPKSMVFLGLFSDGCRRISTK